MELTEITVVQVAAAHRHLLAVLGVMVVLPHQVKVTQVEMLVHKAAAVVAVLVLLEALVQLHLLTMLVTVVQE
jgi:hypothetical protein